MKLFFGRMIATVVAVVSCVGAFAQGEVEDYKRAFSAPQRFAWNKVTGTVSEVTWTKEGDKLYYRLHEKDGDKYV